MRRRGTRSAAVILAAWAVAAAAAGAESRPAKPETPESVTQAYFDAMQAGRVKDAMEYMHPEALKQFRDTLLPLVEMVETMDKDRPARRRFFAMFDGVEDTAALRKLSHKALVASLLKGIMKLQPGSRESLAKAKIKLIGHVKEGDSLAHVVYRMEVSVQGSTASRVSAISLRRHRAGWRLLLMTEIRNVVEMIRSSLSKKTP